jgi:hypothetical protein
LQNSVSNRGHFLDQDFSGGLMFRTIRSTFVHRFAATAIAAGLVSSLAAIGCGSSSDNTTPPTVCDLAGVEALFGLKNCTLGGCHDSSGSSAGLNLTADGLPGRLLGQSPKANMGLVVSSCAGMGKVYLNPGSNPATGLLIDKLTPTFGGCGMRMPSGGSPLTDSQMECVRSWALTLTSP